MTNVTASFYLLDEYPVDEDEGERHNQQDVRKVENKLKLGNAAISCEVTKEALPKNFRKNLKIKAKFYISPEKMFEICLLKFTGQL